MCVVDLNLSARGEISDSFGSDYTGECAVRFSTMGSFNYTDDGSTVSSETLVHVYQSKRRCQPGDIILN